MEILDTKTRTDYGNDCMIYGAYMLVEIKDDMFAIVGIKHYTGWAESTDPYFETFNSRTKAHRAFDKL